MVALKNEGIMGRFGAGILATRIREYWQKRGFSPAVWVEAVYPDEEAPRLFQVRSDIGETILAQNKDACS